MSFYFLHSLRLLEFPCQKIWLHTRILDKVLFSVRVYVNSELALHLLCVFHMVLGIYLLAVFKSMRVTVPWLKILTLLILALQLFVLYKQLLVLMERLLMPGLFQLLFGLIFFYSLEDLILYLKVLKFNVKGFSLIFFFVNFEFKLYFYSVILLFFRLFSDLFLPVFLLCVLQG